MSNPTVVEGVGVLTKKNSLLNGISLVIFSVSAGIAFYSRRGRLYSPLCSIGLRCNLFFHFLGFGKFSKLSHPLIAQFNPTYFNFQMSSCKPFEIWMLDCFSLDKYHLINLACFKLCKYKAARDNSNILLWRQRFIIWNNGTPFTNMRKNYFYKTFCPHLNFNKTWV